MDLVSLLELFPAILEASIDGNNSALRRLRLVNKEAAVLALLALKSFILTLRAGAKHTVIADTRLLQSCHLQKLEVALHSSAYFNPASLLQEFVNLAGASLTTVTSLSLLLDIFPGGADNAAAVDVSLAVLTAACHALTSLDVQGILSAELLQSVGEACPLLTALVLSTRSAGDGDIPYLQQLLQLQPQLLPQLRSLTLPGLLHHHPNMTGNTSVHSLNLPGFHFFEEELWVGLPPNLQHLSCSSTGCGPPAIQDGGTALLQGLTTLHIHNPRMGLRTAASILRHAPALNTITVGRTPFCAFDCDLRHPNIAADLAVMAQRMDIDLIKNGELSISCFQATGQAPLQPFIDTLPRMPEVRRCKLKFCIPAQLAQLLDRFPGVQHLQICFMGGMNDGVLQLVGVCTNLASLDLHRCGAVTPAGILALCERLPAGCVITS